MRLKLQPATVEDAEAVAALRNAVSDDLTFKHGKGSWTRHSTTAGVLQDLRNAQLYVAVHRDEIVASLVLDTKIPWSTDLRKISKAKRPLFLTSMVVAPELQRQGVGRSCLAEVAKIFRRAKADAVLLETFDHRTAGAGPFYARCGWRVCGGAKSCDALVIYYELL